MNRSIFWLLALIHTPFYALCDNAPSLSKQANNPSSIFELSNDHKLNAFDQFGVGGDLSQFGHSIDAMGDVAVVGAPGAMGHGLAFIYQFDGNDWQLSDTLIPDDGQQGDEFGFAVSIHHNRIVVGSREASVDRDELGKAYVFVFNDQSNEWEQTQTLLASDSDDNDEFGAAITQNEDTLVIGAPQYNQNGYRGQVYVFKVVNDEWVETEKIPGGGKFGHALAIMGSQLYIGAEDSALAGFNRAGAVFIYDYNGSNWGLSQALTASDAEESQFFGSSIDVSNGVLVIGADKDGRFGDGDGPGAAYLYGLNGQLWEEQQKVTAPNETHFNLFGSHVKFSAGQLFVSSISDEVTDPFDGHVHVFEDSGAAWVYANTLGPLVGSTDDEMGFTLAGTGTELLVGAYGDDSQDNEAGSFHSFSYTAPIWTTNAKTDMLPGSAHNYFAASTAIDGSHMMLGSYGDDVLVEQSGSVYTYFLSNDEWVAGTKILANDAAPFQSFGYSIDIDADRAIIGAPAFDVDVNDPGAAYIFEFNGSNWEYEAKITASDGLDDDYFGGSVSVYGDYVLVGGTGSDTFGDRSGAAYVFKKDKGVWIEVKRLVFPNAQEDDYIGLDLAINDDWAVIGQSDAVHFFAAASDWEHVQSITGFGRFGSALDLDGETVLVGSYLNTNVGGGRGSASIYQFDGVSWQQEQFFYPKLGGFDFFGTDVSISGNNLMVGSSWAGVSGAYYSGAAYWYINDGNSWVEARTLVAENSSRWDLLGGSVAMDGQQVVVGALGVDDYGTNSGAAFTYKATDVIFKNGFDTQ